MNNSEYNRNLFSAVETYLDDENFEGDRNFELRNEGGLSFIHKWDIPIPQPTPEQLRVVPLEKINKRKRISRNQKRLFKFPKMTQVERDELKPVDGLALLNDDTGKINFCVDGVWVEL